jgi:uncharacterized protein (DUF305 family)
MRDRSTRALGAVVLSLALAATSCGSDDPSGQGSGTSAEVSTTEHNDVDVAFATGMIQHHAQALSMVDLTLGRTLDPDVRRLAEAIREAQAPEIEIMADWLTDWDEEVPSTVRDHVHAGHDGASESGEDMGDGQPPGMLSAEDLAAVQHASDTEFRTRWLEMMIEHHTGAVEMAETEQSDGRYQPAVELAGDIVESQTAEIETMRDLLGS